MNKNGDAQPCSAKSRQTNIADQIRSVLRNEQGLRLAMLYGSAAHDALRADSDVDIAVLFASPLTAETKLDLTARLEQALRRTVDLVDLHAVRGTILKQILCHGRVLIRNRPDALAPLIETMVYNQTDMMPYVRRTLSERQKRFAHG